MPLNMPPVLSSFFAVVLLAALVQGLPVRAGQNVTQTISLQPGWNSVWLEVAPTNSDPNVVFAGVPVASVWTFAARLTSTDFIQDPSETGWNRSAWLSFVPTNQPAAINNNLFDIQGGRAFLIECQSAATWSVTGRPSFRSYPWVQNAYNLRGFPIDPATPPSFGAFFGPSTAHVDPATGALNEMYRLSPAGTWQRVLAQDVVQAGVAYWVYTRGASDYLAPTVATLPAGDGLDYSRSLPEIPLVVANRRTTPITVSLRELQRSQEPTSLAEGTLGDGASNVWTSLPTTTTKALAAADSGSMRLAVQRSKISGTRYESILEVTDGVGVRFRIPVTAERINASEEARSRAGLWVGTIQVKAVSEAHSGSLVTNAASSTFLPTANGSITNQSSTAPLQVSRIGNSATPVPTHSEFNLRVLIHVDTNGTPRLLREVTQLWQDGTYTVDGVGRRVPGTPGRYVLVTDERRIPELKGASLRDGETVGRRISAIGFDFPIDSPAANFLPLTGNFAAGQVISGTIALPENHPTNPFRHRYHPDHDNLAGDFRTPVSESFLIRRQLEFSLLGNDPRGGSASPDYGYSEIAGFYFETVTGLHQYPIRAQGTFRLQRISEIASLNP
jgi:hypothetical protein